MKKFIATMCLLAVFVLSTSSGVYLVNTYTDAEFVNTKVGPVPIEQLFGDLVHGDDFYKDFTK